MDTETTPNQTNASQREHGKNAKRKFTAAFKARIVELTNQPGAVVSDVAQAYDLNPSMVTRWRRQQRDTSKVDSFVPVQMSSPAASVQEIRIECARGPQQVCITRPTSAAKECAQWLREWLT